jgi:hypothetical protein
MSVAIGRSLASEDGLRRARGFPARLHEPLRRHRIRWRRPAHPDYLNLFNFIKGAFSASRALQGLVENETADTLSLASRVDIVVRPASFRSTRGSTCVGVMCD